MTKDEAKELFAKIKANRKLFEECVMHTFTYPEDFAQKPLGAKFTCMLCGCTVDPQIADAYARGFRAAGGNIELVLKEFYN